MTIRITYHSACVLQALANGACYGFDIMDATDLPSGTVYPILRRFEDQGLVRSKWEHPKAARQAARPRRRNYQLTQTGLAELTAATERFRAHEKLFGKATASP